jgi:hypothetical protein
MTLYACGYGIAPKPRPAYPHKSYYFWTSRETIVFNTCLN